MMTSDMDGLRANMRTDASGSAIGRRNIVEVKDAPGRWFGAYQVPLMTYEFEMIACMSL